jgi:flavin reductase (DIM6/NTAB) family NADH-FMN oxidoreductase RutF
LQAESSTKDSKADPNNGREKLGKAIGRIASGVYVATCERDGERHGILMSWVSQAAFEPPMISLAVKSGRPMLSALSKDTKFVLNVLSKTNHEIFKNFARPDLPDATRFEGIPLLSQGPFGPVFSGAVAYLECYVRSSMQAGDHFVLVAEVVGGDILDSHAEPMVHLRKSGFQY